MWPPLSETRLRELISAAEPWLGPAELAFWEQIKITPVKWQLPPWGDEGGGFWVIGIWGQRCLWYNDIEEGFNVSPYSQFGVIGEYRCNQSELASAIAWSHEEFMAPIQEGVALKARHNL